MVVLDWMVAMIWISLTGSELWSGLVGWLSACGRPIALKYDSRGFQRLVIRP